MKLLHSFAALAAATVTALLVSTPAAAQATRTWVSGVGDDANPCSRTAPCKTFAGAIAKTSTAGEIDCLDPGGFGALTITKAITINCNSPGGIGGVLVSGTNGFVVSVPAGSYVQLIGLDINGLAGVNSPSTPGLSGVLVQNGTVLISQSYIYGFTGGTCGPGGLVPGGSGVCVSGPAGTKVIIEDTKISNNTNGVVNAPNGGANTVEIEHSLLNFNATVNVENNGAGSKTYLNGDTLTNSPTATINTGGTLFTSQNNNITGTTAALTANPRQ